MHLLVNELYVYRKARCKNRKMKNLLRHFSRTCFRRRRQVSTLHLFLNLNISLLFFKIVRACQVHTDENELEAISKI